jgi:hypothetical protein
MRGANVRPDQTYQWQHLPSINMASFESIGSAGMAMSLFGTTSTAWPLTNLALLVPFSTWQTLSIKGVCWMNGTTTGGNIDIGIYDSLAVTRLTSLGTTARGNVSASNTATLSTYVLAPGDYYMALSHDGTSNIAGGAPVAGLCAAAGILEATSAFPLPATITPAITTRAFIPVLGFLLDSTAL